MARDHKRFAAWDGGFRTRDDRHQARREVYPRLPRMDSLPPTRIRVVIAHRHEVFRVGVRTLLHGERDLEVVGQAHSVGKMLSESRRTRPKVILLEAGLSNGLESHIYRTLVHTFPSVRIIGVIRDRNADTFRHAVKAGVQGYLPENTGRTELIRAIRTVAQGEPYFASEGIDQIVHVLRRQREAVWCRSMLHFLSPQERRALALLVKGHTNKEIAVELRLSSTTVKNCLASMFAKLQITRRTQAVVMHLKAEHYLKREEKIVEQ